MKLKKIIIIIMMLFSIINLETKVKAADDLYPEATYIWNYLKNQGYNDAVAAGILGNIATECAGSELYLEPFVYSKSKKYYGICQWGLRWYPEIANATLEKQCEFLMSNIESTINLFGDDYYKDFDYTAFVLLENERDAALAFAKCYERCYEDSYEERQENATFTLNYYKNII